jgi:ABC-type multidrug transport system ATPase subunit
MITSIEIRNFKLFKDTGVISLNKQVIFVGPNNSGKTTALQALTLWHLGINRWMEKRSEKSKARAKTGVQLNRKDILTIPVSSAKYLWNDLLLKTNKGKDKITIRIDVSGVTNDTVWHCSMSFDYFGDEVIYCKPLHDENIILTRPELLRNLRIAYIPPISGLASREDKLMPASILARIGQGITSEVLRNLCYYIRHPEYELQLPQNTSPEENWQRFVNIVKDFFGITLLEPEINERGEIELFYLDAKEVKLELPATGRGQQQIMLLLALLLTNPNTIILLDEPDAHLEILRQRQVYKLITELAAESNSQLIIASHSEVILNEASEKDTVIAFIGKPHQINDKGSQLLKSLASIGFEHYYQAEQKKWMLFLEGSTDLAILKKFAVILNHPVSPYLETAYVHYVATNVPNKAREHFYRLKEAVPGLKGVAIFDRINAQLQQEELYEVCWHKREIENYFFRPRLLEQYVAGNATDDLFESGARAYRSENMRLACKKIIPPIAMENPDDEYWNDRKASEEIERIFKEYARSMNLPNLITKGNFWEILNYIPKNDIDNEVIEKLDVIYSIAKEFE